MTPAEGIAKFGFRRWYERQLIESHLYFVTCFLSMILVAASLEQLDWRESAGQFFYLLVVVIAATAVCLASLRQYSFLMGRAECLGSQSSCGRCKAYGVIRVLRAGSPETAAAAWMRRADNSWIYVCCKKCGHEWRMDNE